jgi:hypothetical protein
MRKVKTDCDIRVRRRKKKKKREAKEEKGVRLNRAEQVVRGRFFMAKTCTLKRVYIDS